MIPVIDVSAVAIFSAIGTFLLALWHIIKSIFEWVQNKFVLWILGSKLGRAIAEFGLFAFIYSLFLLFVQEILSQFLRYTISALVPDSLYSVFQFLECFFPLSQLFDTIEFGFTLYLGTRTITRIYNFWWRNTYWLKQLLHTGRL